MGTRGIKVLKCLSDETRYKILLLLDEGEKCVCELVKELGKKQPLVSHHLKLMKKCGLVSSRKEGRKTYYRVAKPKLSKALEVLSKL